MKSLISEIIRYHPGLVESKLLQLVQAKTNAGKSVPKVRCGDGRPDYTIDIYSLYVVKQKVSDEILISDSRKSSASLSCQMMHPWSKRLALFWDEMKIANHQMLFQKKTRLVPGNDAGLHQRWVHRRRRWHRRSQQTRCSLGEMSPGTAPTWRDFSYKEYMLPATAQRKDISCVISKVWNHSKNGDRTLEGTSKYKSYKSKFKMKSCSSFQ